MLKIITTVLGHTDPPVGGTSIREEEHALCYWQGVPARCCRFTTRRASRVRSGASSPGESGFKGWSPAGARLGRVRGSDGRRPGYAPQASALRLPTRLQDTEQPVPPPAPLSPTDNITRAWPSCVHSPAPKPAIRLYNSAHIRNIVYGNDANAHIATPFPPMKKRLQPNSASS